MNKYEGITAVAFDCFNTVFVLLAEHYKQVKDYAKHVNNPDFKPYIFPKEWYDLESHTDAIDGIRLMREKGYYCIAMSNGNPELILANSNKSGIVWDHVMDLASHGVYKPNKLAYPLIGLDTGFPPSATLMVTANPTFGDIEGARYCGMQTCTIIRNGKHAYNILDLANDLCVL